jgi:nicotinamide-nucleotide amidase
METEVIARAVTQLAAECLKSGKRIATVESCTGGRVAAACTDLAGSSAWFERGWVTYSNAAKMQAVGVTPGTLATYGAVSEATAREMAVGGLVHSEADLCVAITGIAGPTGATPDKPVGMVCFALAVRGQGVSAETQHFAGDRAQVRQQAVAWALHRMIEKV